MPVYRVVVRHSPLPVSELDVLAASPEEAVDLLVKHNIEHAGQFKTGPAVVKQVEAWAAGDRADVTVEVVGGEAAEEGGGDDTAEGLDEEAPNAEPLAVRLQQHQTEAVEEKPRKRRNALRELEVTEELASK